MSKQVSGPRKIGNVFAIPLGDGKYGYGRVLREPLMAFYDLRTSGIADLDEVLKSPIAFSVWVMHRALTGGAWRIIGNAPLEKSLLEEPLIFKEDPISRALSVYRGSTGEEKPATREQCSQLERAAVWSQNHIVDRLFDHFSGRQCKWGGKGR
jgi:hypothetical protein